MQSVKKQEAPAGGATATVTTVQDVKAQERRKNIDFIIKNLIAGGIHTHKYIKSYQNCKTFFSVKNLRTMNHEVIRYNEVEVKCCLTIS